MRHLKMLGLAAVAAGALMAILGAGTASATTLCSTTVETCPAAQKVTVPLVFSLKSGTKAILKDTEGGTLDECSTSEVGGSITNSGSSTATVTGKITKLTWGGPCTFTTNTVHFGCLEIHKITGTSNGTLTSDACPGLTGGSGNSEVTINTVFFGSCIYGIESGKSIGDLTEGNPAEFTANAVAKKLSGSAIACPETSRWTATYVMTEPKTTVSVSNG